MSRSVSALYAEVGLRGLPKILGLLDRNRLSPTYGCFDKAYWHYRTAAFPSGMAQEFVLPLALVYRYRFPGGEGYVGQPRLREWVLAGIHYAARSAHRDGSCDDYFPYERALGAAAFSLYACSESALLLELRDATLEAFFRRRGQWLIRHGESGLLANHHALVVLALYNVYLYTRDAAFRHAARARLQQLLGWQSAEGWFPEYEGCDPGYTTATIDFLAKYYRKSGDAQVLAPLRRAVQFVADFMHPDGSFAGEYGSRNTYLFFPHGFELLAPQVPEALWLAERYVQGLRRGLRVFLEDDRLIGHLTYNHLQAALDCWPQRQGGLAPAPGCRHWPEAGLYVYRRDSLYAVVSLAKGGVCKIFVNDRLLYGDSGLIARQRNGRCLVSHLIDRYESTLAEDSVTVGGYFGYVRYRLPSLPAVLAFYAFMATVGRLGRNAVRRVLQRLLIVGKRRAPLRFRRTLRFAPHVTLCDEVWDLRPRRQGRRQLVDLYAGTDHTSIYVAMSNAYHPACLLPWHDYGAQLPQLWQTGYLRVCRTLYPERVQP
ncbi:MAG: hypothetical protein KatS3mg131_3186 [Candidatus Tectimicrobiota bacterium]|nr:MAG: hypothetical protein KatS3mg131_3186 [Candidatus Tectomicrobia bacterium]